MKGIYGTTVNGEDVRYLANAITRIAQTRKGITLEVIETAVQKVKEHFVTDATLNTDEIEG